MSASLPKKRHVILPEDVGDDGAVPLLGYQRAVRATDHLTSDDLSTPILGLFGEVGSLLAVVKKKRRDATAYAAYRTAIIEELGDVLWYLTCIACHADLDMSVLSQRVFRDCADWDDVESDEFGTWADIQSQRPATAYEELSMCMGTLAELTGELVGDSRAGRLGG